jgi:hypothetical protein
MTVDTHAPTLRAALLPRTRPLTDVLLVCAGAGLIAASAQVSFKLPFTPVPITGQTRSSRATRSSSTSPRRPCRRRGGLPGAQDGELIRDLVLAPVEAVDGGRPPARGPGLSPFAGHLQDAPP